MTYLIKDPSEIGPRKYLVVDMPRFAAEMSAALGFAPTMEKRDNLWTLCSPDEKLVVELYTEQYSEAKAKRVVISCYLPDVPPGDRPSSSGYNGHLYAMPSITVSAERDMESIVRDVKKRVIEASVEPAANIRKYQADRIAERGGLKVAMERMTAKFGENIRFHTDSASNYSCGFSWHFRGRGPQSPEFCKFYIDGRVGSDGSITIDRMPNVTLPVMEALITAALASKEIR